MGVDPRKAKLLQSHWLATWSCEVLVIDTVRESPTPRMQKLVLKTCDVAIRGNGQTHATTTRRISAHWLASWSCEALVIDTVRESLTSIIQKFVLMMSPSEAMDKHMLQSIAGALSKKAGQCAGNRICPAK